MNTITPGYTENLTDPSPGSLTAADSWFKTRLEAAGHTVTTLDDNGLTAGSVAGFSAVVVSASVAAGTLGSVLNSVTVPVVISNAAVAANMGLTGVTSGTHYGTTASQTQVAVTAAGAGHPLGAGTPVGAATVASSAVTIGWGVPAGTATVAATVQGDAGKATVFGLSGPRASSWRSGGTRSSIDG